MTPIYSPGCRKGCTCRGAVQRGGMSSAFMLRGWEVGATFPGGDCTLMVGVSARRTGWEVDLIQGEVPPR